MAETSWWSDALDSVSQTAKSVGTDLVDIAGKTIVANAANMASNKIDAVKSRGKNTADAATNAPIAKGINADGSPVVPVYSNAGQSTGGGVPTWAWVLGGVSAAAVVIGVVMVVRK